MNCVLGPKESSSRFLCWTYKWQPKIFRCEQGRHDINRWSWQWRWRIIDRILEVFSRISKKGRKKNASSPWPGARFTDYLLTIWESRDVVLWRSFESHLFPVVPCLLSWWCVTSALSYRKDIPDQCSPNSGQRVNTFDYKCWVLIKSTHGSVHCHLFVYCNHP